MNKENVLFGIIGLLLGLIIGFVATNYINRTEYNQSLVAQRPNVPASNPAGSTAPFAGAQQQQPPQVNNQVVRDQSATGGMMPQVQQTLDRAKNEPNNFEAQLAAGNMYYQIQRFDEAAQYFEKASQLKPDDYNVLVKTGNAYYDANKFEAAEKWYTRALAKNPDDVNVRTDLGLTFFLREPRNVDRAIQEYRTSLEKNPNHELTLQNLAAALKEKGDVAGLQETLARLEKVNPNNPILKNAKNS